MKVYIVFVKDLENCWTNVAEPASWNPQCIHRLALFSWHKVCQTEMSSLAATEIRAWSLAETCSN